MSKYLQGDVVGHKFIHSAFYPAFATSDATKSYPVFYAERDVTVTAVRLIPQAAVTGADTNTRHLNLDNKGLDGTGTTELAALDLVLGTDLVAMDAFELYAPAAGLDLSAGAVLALEGEEIGTGQATPEMIVVTEYELQ